MDIQNDKLFSKKEFLELLKITNPTFNKYRAKDELPDPVVLVGQEYWLASVINDWILECNPHLITDDLANAAAIAITSSEIAQAAQSAIASSK